MGGVELVNVGGAKQGTVINDRLHQYKKDVSTVSNVLIKILLAQGERERVTLCDSVCTCRLT